MFNLNFQVLLNLLRADVVRLHESLSDAKKKNWKR